MSDEEEAMSVEDSKSFILYEDVNENMNGDLNEDCLRVNKVEEDDEVVVLFDLETTGLDKHAQVLQIAAKWGVSEFNVYIMPTVPIHPMAAAVNGFMRVEDRLYVHGYEVFTIPLYIAVKQFLAYLRNLSGNNKCTLVAHNAKFHGFYLVKVVTAVGLYDEFDSICRGIADSVSLFRKVAPYLQKYSMEFLVSKLFPRENFRLHNALGDVRALDCLIDHLGAENMDWFNSVKPLTDFIREP